MSIKNKILEHYQIYISRTGKDGINSEELVPLILNLAYLEILQQRQKGIDVDILNTFNEYRSSVKEIFPEIDLIGAWPGFIPTVEWDGIWNFLTEYFQSKLGISIDEENRVTNRFDSTRHRRYENDILTSSSEVDRKITFVFADNKSECQISISETLSQKQAYLESINGNSHTYIGSDPDFLFIITYDSFDNIENFSLYRTDKNLRIDYLE